MIMRADAFDADYYRRFYEDAESRAVAPEEQVRLAAFICAYLAHLEVPVERVVDLGCGLGTLLRALGQAFPAAACTGVEISPYLCEKYGWHNASVDTFEDEPFDLVICSDVLAYLDDKSCAGALKNIARLTTSALYLSVLTEEDLPICDQQATDMRQTLRPVAWYRRRLQRHFVAVGGGLFLKRPLAFPVWQMEQA